MPEAQKNETVTIMHGPNAYQVNRDGVAYLLNPFDEAVRDARYLRAGGGHWMTGQHFAPVEYGLADALESAWAGMQG